MRWAAEANDALARSAPFNPLVMEAEIDVMSRLYAQHVNARFKYLFTFKVNAALTKKNSAYPLHSPRRCAIILMSPFTFIPATSAVM